MLDLDKISPWLIFYINKRECNHSRVKEINSHNVIVNDQSSKKANIKEIFTITKSTQELYIQFHAKILDT